MDEQVVLSVSQQDYLREIYVLSLENEKVRVTDVATVLGISKASVNRAVNVLKEAGYLEHEHYGTLRLTETGCTTAKNIYDNYKVVYRFLTDVLGVDIITAEEEAHRIEHDIGRGTRKKLKKYMKKKK